MRGKLQAEDYNGRMVVWHEGWAWNDTYRERTYLAGKDEYDACIHCGRQTSKKGQAMGVLISEGGDAFILPSDYLTYPHDGGEMGWFPVGRECIKDVPRDYWAPDPLPR